MKLQLTKSAPLLQTEVAGANCSTTVLAFVASQ